MDKEKEIQNYALCFASAIENIVRDKDNENYIEVDDENATEVMIGLILGVGFAFNRLTGNYSNYLEFTHIANQLVVQYLMEYGKVADKNTQN